MAALLKRKSLDLGLIKRIKYENNGNRVADHTRMSLLSIGKKYNNFLKDNKMQIDQNSVSKFLLEEKNTMSSATYNLSRQHLKKLLKHTPTIKENYMKRVLVDEIFSDIKPLRQDKKVVDYLSQSQVLQLILGSEPHIALIIEFLFKTGVRISEMINIRLQDCKVDNQVRIRIIGKGSKQRAVFIDLELYRRIRKEFCGLFYLFENRRQHQYDRSNLFRKIKQSGKEILGKEVNIHLLRHSTANFLLKECGKSPKYVAEFLGHSDPAITLSMYIHEEVGSEVVELFKYGKERRRNVGK